MKFQKTLLAAALALTSFTMANAAESVKGEQVVDQYAFTEEGATEPTYVYVIGNKVYTRDLIDGSTADYKFNELENETVATIKADGYTFVRGGLVGTDTIVGGPEEPELTEVLADTPHTWNYSLSSNTTVVGDEVQFSGNVTSEIAGDEQAVDGLLEEADTTIVGNGKFQNLSVGAFEGSNGNNLGVLSSEVLVAANGTTTVAGTALNAHGLTLIKANPENLNGNVSINYETGTLTSQQITGGTAVATTPLKAYGTISEAGVRDAQVIEFNGKYYTVAADKTLTETTVDSIENLTLVGAGAASGLFGGVTNQINSTAFVGATKTVYGESVQSFDNAGQILVGGSDTNASAGVIPAGTDFQVGTNGPITTKSQSVETGIIATDSEGGNIYGLEVKKSTTDANGTTSAKTTITADYVDSGDFRINGVSIVDNIQTTVDDAVGGATAQIDAKVAEVDQRLTQFNTTAGQLNSRVNQLNSRIDDVEKTAYRGVAIALAAQQQIPNIGAGQFAVFGGVGHYEGESAGALGVASVFADGRTSVSAALGFAGGNEVGGRVGVSYVFGGK
ncbi:YadA C-terminal domain-containing protein [Acinetobacter indicus]|uniref:YadA C-terminal domain-containing protein n=1 Tax=Acinetobacter indicus TaxID=756892 RepID=UPI002576D387|nr:YadA C-terminal domain-containing protein [Acinetobacter indicus]MDM1285166.1 YadA C-terminal domain-containing protein [Acinetobacter indicus]